MWRAFFLAIGICLLILGTECLVIDKAVLAVTKDQAAPNLIGNPRVITPYEWTPWSLLTGGVVVILYSFTVSRKKE